MGKRGILVLFAAAILPAASPAAPPAVNLRVHLSWGHEQRSARTYSVSVVPESRVQIQDVQPRGLEPGESERDGAWQTKAGAGDVDGLDFTVTCAQDNRRIGDLQLIWSDLFAASDAGAARRLTEDPALLKDPAKFTVELNRDHTSGFSVAVSQLLAEKAIWIPSLGVYLTIGDPGVPFAEHMKSLSVWKGRRILEQVAYEPEATYNQYAARWEDMASPFYTNPEQRGPGHIVGLSWDSAIPKFGIDRGSGVWSDYGNPDKFQLWFAFDDLTHGLATFWKQQHLDNGLPVVTTVIERDGVRYEVEQFAYPLDGPPAERRGDISMVLLEKVRLTDLTGKGQTVLLTLHHRREFPPDTNASFSLDRLDGRWLLRESAHQRGLLMLEGPIHPLNWSGTKDNQKQLKRVDLFYTVDLPAAGSREFVVKLPSPMAGPGEIETLARLDYGSARTATLKFWRDYVARGTQIHVPEERVNDLFRANLWHALRLPRRHGGSSPDVRIDLPYSNFAYSQTGTPWPVNQAVYVDYMLYDLRGYHDIATEELIAQFRNNQESNGHVNGNANWLVYTPGMLYAVAQHYLLTGNRADFERLLPYSLKALDWCLNQLGSDSGASMQTRGLVNGPLNDITGDGWWAFNQAYMYAGLELFGKALQSAGHPRAEECLQAAGRLHDAIGIAFHAATTQATLVQLRDHTWVPYVPTETTTPRRLYEQWYPTDVDTGPVHLIRLKAIDANGDLANWLLNDHEDNLYYKGWGIANEPVYNQQATAYLLRDEPEAAIRTFYSYMASAFSHSDLEPVEHRWTHGQYFGPPSTDGAWFELYRNMLIHERDDGSLVLGMATPRPWLGDGQSIDVMRAPTYYGLISMHIVSKISTGTISARVELTGSNRPSTLFVRFRPPAKRTMRSATVNGSDWSDFDPEREWVRVPNPAAERYVIEAKY